MGREERVALPDTVRVRRGGPGPGLVVALVVAAFLLGLIRPWDWLGGGLPAGEGLEPGGAPSEGTLSGDASPGGPGRAAGQVSGASAASEVATPPLAPFVQPTCAYPESWRVASLQDWAGHEAQVWTAAKAVEATGPGDPAIPFQPVASTAVTAFGWCAPVSGPGRPPLAATGTLFRLDSDGAARDVPYDRLQPAAADALGELWMPKAQSVGRRPPWQVGRYVIRLAAPGGFVRYLGIEVVAAVRASPTTTDEPGAGATPGQGVATSSPMATSSP